MPMEAKEIPTGDCNENSKKILRNPFETLGANKEFKKLSAVAS